jgi:peptidoglycan/LPS O-acetylase OafA/YrhL
MQKNIDLKEVFQYSKRIIGLDLIRSFAILLVFWGHGVLIIPNEFRDEANLLVFMDGVNVFFVLSGFLIGGILLKVIFNSSYTYFHLLDFWVRRWVRTIPLYFLVLCFLIIINFKEWEYHYEFFYFAQNLFKVQFPFFHVSWSLAVEEWFYLSLPLMVFIFHKLINSKKTSILIGISLFLFGPILLRILHFPYDGLSKPIFRGVVLYRMDMMMFGVFLAYLCNQFPKFIYNVKFKFLIGGLLIMLGLLLFHLNSYFLWFKINFGLFFKVVFYDNLEAISIFLIIPYFANIKKLNFNFLNKLITFISKTSYSVYLLHGSVLLWFYIPKWQIYIQNTGVRFELEMLMLNLIYWIGSFGLAYFIYTFFEKPILNMRDKLSIINRLN